MSFVHKARTRPARRPERLATPALAILGAALVFLSGCGPVKLVATTNIPPPLVVKLPVSVALFVPPEFATFIHNEERAGTDWHVELGRAQTDGLTRLLNAMFERVVRVDSLNAGSAVPDVRAILEPSIEEYAFVTPRDAGSPFFAVSIKYRINVYTPDGRLADSWGFTGYGTAPSQGISSDMPLTQATALALRDAGAKLAVEFREQAIVRGLLPQDAVPDTPVAPPGTTSPTMPENEAPPGTAPAEAAAGEAPGIGGDAPDAEDGPSEQAPTEEQTAPQPRPEEKQPAVSTPQSLA